MHLDIGTPLSVLLQECCSTTWEELESTIQRVLTTPISKKQEEEEKKKRKRKRKTRKNKSASKKRRSKTCKQCGRGEVLVLNLRNVFCSIGLK